MITIMKNFLEFLSNFTPVFAVGAIALFMTLEKLLPYFEHGKGRNRQRRHNLGMIAIAFVLNATLGGFVVAAILWSQTNHIGLLHQLLGQSVPAVVLGILLIDLNSYVFHVLYHKIPFFWRFHRVHHADTELDASDGLRLHPGEFVFQTITQLTFLPLLGVSLTSMTIYFAFALPWFSLNHANIRYPDWFERWFNLIFTTPNWHRVHHSSYRPETDSHYGDVFTFWDRLFGTAGKADVEKMQFGIELFREPGEQSLWELLKMPFKQL